MTLEGVKSMKISWFSSTLITAYLLTCGTLYLWGFWLHFELNILQFINISDIVKSTIWPMITVLFMYIIQQVISYINNPMSQDSKNLWEAGGGYRGVVLLQYAFLAFVFISGLYGLGDRFLNGEKADKYFCIGLIFLFSVSLFVAYKTKFLAETGKLRGFSIVIIFLCPMVFMNKGIMDAQDILAGKNSFLVRSNAKCSENTNEKFRYIATLSDKGFAYSLSNKTLCIFNFDYMVLYKEPYTEPAKKGIAKYNDKIGKFFGG
ncbi:hypothetical protein ACTVMN_09995 [Serratia nematodiphila]